MATGNDQKTSKNKVFVEGPGLIRWGKGYQMFSIIPLPN